MIAKRQAGRGGHNRTYISGAKSLHDIVNSSSRHGCIIGVRETQLCLPFAEGVARRCAKRLIAARLRSRNEDAPRWFHDSAARHRKSAENEKIEGIFGRCGLIESEVVRV